MVIWFAIHASNLCPKPGLILCPIGSIVNCRGPELDTQGMVLDSGGLITTTHTRTRCEPQRLVVGGVILAGLEEDSLIHLGIEYDVPSPPPGLSRKASCGAGQEGRGEFGVV